MRRALDRAPWLLLLLFPLVELGGHAVVRAGVAPLSDWRAAAERVRSERADGDLITVAPAWADPLLRQVLGDQIDLAMAGRSDAAAYRRIWSLGIRGARPPEAPPRPPDLSHSFGQVTVQRWDVGDGDVVADLVRQIGEARVRLGDTPCPWRRGSRPRGGGLGKGVLYPAERFACDPKRSWLWVAPVVLEDLSLTPRRCVWQHPAGPRPVTVELPTQPLADRLVFYAGLYYEHERMRRGGPVTAVIRLDGAEVGRMVHRDGDGWKRLEVALPGAGRSGALAIEVTAPRPHLRSFCWAATLRGKAP